ncbi:MAG: hypothetical protein Q9162_005758 [Coniocarpon cinnabarinum]
MTSLSFSTPSNVLTSVGVSVSDIALLAGAGRSVITWLRAKWADRSLLEMLGLDQKDIIPRLRRGNIDPSLLQARWTQRVDLFLDGERRTFTKKHAARLLRHETLDMFTWYMTLIVAALKAAASQRCLRNVVTEFLLKQCEESEGYEFLFRELDHHLEAWQSIADTRNISRAAKDSWDTLGRRGQHPPGLLPDMEHPEILRFIRWLSGAMNFEDHIFWTPSSDIVSLALLLQDIGMQGICVRAAFDNIDESQLAVVMDRDRALARANFGAAKARGGFRINLNALEDVALQLRGTSAEKIRHRRIFCLGLEASKDLTFTPALLIEGGLPEDLEARRQPCFAVAPLPNDLVDESTGIDIEDLLLCRSSQAARAMTKFRASGQYCEPKFGPSSDRSVDESLVFLLGYYYGALSPLLNVSRMGVVEAFSTFSWHDRIEFFDLLGTRQPSDAYANTSLSRHTKIVERSFIMKLVAYLFAGADIDQLKAVQPGCCGIHGKLTIVDATLLGNTDSSDDICRFALLDIDRTTFPANAQGLMMQSKPTRRKVESFGEVQLTEKSGASLEGPAEDFTSAIEPNWGIDHSAPVVTYRNKGRVIQRFCPDELYAAVLFGHNMISSIPDHVTEICLPFSEANVQALRLSSADASRFNRGICREFAIPLSALDDGIIRTPSPTPEETDILCVATRSLPKIRCCVACALGLTMMEGAQRSDRIVSAKLSFAPSDALIYEVNEVPHRLLVIS